MACVTPFVAVIALALGAAAQQQQSPPLTSSIKDSKGLETLPKPPEPTALTPVMRGDIFMARKQYRDAIDMYKSVPETPITINKIGIAYHQMLDLNTAEQYYKRAIKMDKRYAEAINNLGTVYYAKKKYRGAIKQYKKALKLSPKAASIYSNLGTAQFARKHYKKAMEAYQEALALDPDVFEHRNSAGVLLQERTVEERAKFHYYQAKLYAKAGMADRALLCLRKALEEGLKERDKIAEEPAFAKMRDLPAFQELLTYQPRVL